jgi:hypothetical protein
MAPRRAPSCEGLGVVQATSVPPCSSMIFFTMGRPRPVPFLARRHVRLEQPRAVLRQADAVVGDADHGHASSSRVLDTRIMRLVPVGSPLFHKGIQWLRRRS